MSSPHHSPHRGLATLAQLNEFDAIIDARSPAEYAEDHLPGAISLPVLSDDERARVGTVYKQVSVFEAKKIGAALVAKNIAHHIENQLLDKPKEWRPLVYCWRGGQRSGAFGLILREIGWDARRLDGGYKAWRRQIIEQLEQLPSALQFRVITGATGSGKSRLLDALAAQGAQVLHLEEIACHKGSVLGVLPGHAQPSQKFFESRLHAQLSQMDTGRPIFVEAESRKIGQLHLPNSLLAAIRRAPCLSINAALPARVAFLLQDYHYAIADPTWLRERLSHLHALQSRETLARWSELIAAQAFPLLVEELLLRHYDPLYQRSQRDNYADFGTTESYATDDLSATTLNEIATKIIHRHQ